MKFKLIIVLDSFQVNDSSEWNGFKIVGDNIDVNFWRTFQRIGYSTMSHHFFKAFAVKDRVDLGNLSELPPPSVEIDVHQLLPSVDDIKQLKDTVVTLISRYNNALVKSHSVPNSVIRILVTHMNKFKSAASTVTWHIPHLYSPEMKMKSETVSVHCNFDALYSYRYH